MENSLQNISIQKTKKFSDFLKYVYLITKEGLIPWIWYVFLVRIFSGKDSQMVVIKENDQIIGGFCLTNFLLPKYKFYNWFKKDIQLKFDELAKNNYQYFCCFVIKKSFRNKGIGAVAFETYIKQNHLKIWFTSSPGAVRFYLRQGARVYYPSKYDIYVFDESN